MFPSHRFGRSASRVTASFAPSLALTALTVLTLGACALSPVEWEEPLVVETPDSTAVLVIEPDGEPALVRAPDVPAWMPEGACPGSVRLARGADELYAVWWTPRDDGSALLLGARSDDDGATWTTPVPVETTDEWDTGCDRPPPAIAVDAPRGFVHVAYFAHGPQGPGVFFAHSMERAAYFHPPVQVVYGPRPSQVAVAVDRSVVAVAYQDPNTRAPRISVRISRTEGHIFDLPVTGISPANVEAHAPRVSVRGSTVAVGWTARTRTAETVVRVGRAR